METELEAAVEKEAFINRWPVEAHTECSNSDSDKELSPEGPGGLQLESPLLLLVEKDEDILFGFPTRYEMYESELQMPDIMKLMKTALSEPYSIYTYRYFIHNWPQLCVLAKCGNACVGAIVCKLEMHHYNTRRGYIAMLAVDKEYRKRKIGMESNYGEEPSWMLVLHHYVWAGHTPSNTLALG